MRATNATGHQPTGGNAFERQAFRESAEVSTAIGVSRATAQRYLATLAAAGEVKTRLRYGTTGRPEQEFVAATDRSNTAPRKRGG